MQVQRRRIDELTSHPQQGQIYADLSDREFQSLKDDIAKHGLRQPVEITTAGMIVDGHHRVRALRELGFEEVDAIICEEMTDEAIEERFVNANLLRRQLDPITKARAIKRLAEIERRRSGANQDADHDGDLRDRIAKRMGGKVSGRTVDRLLQLLRLPLAVCQAVSANELPMTTALKVEKLSPAIQQTISARITSGEPARHVVAEYLPSKQSASQNTPAGQYQMLVQFLSENISDLDAASDQLVGTAGNHEQTACILKATAAFCRRMQVHERSARRESIAQARELVNRSSPDTVSTR